MVKNGKLLAGLQLTMSLQVKLRLLTRKQVKWAVVGWSCGWCISIHLRATASGDILVRSQVTKWWCIATWYTGKDFQASKKNFKTRGNCCTSQIHYGASCASGWVKVFVWQNCSYQPTASKNCQQEGWEAAKGPSKSGLSTIQTEFMFWSMLVRLQSR